MDNRTQINQEIQSAPQTAINSEIAEQYQARIESVSEVSTGLLETGTIVCDKYTIENRLEVTSGEADLYVCSADGHQYVAKVYKRKFAIKDEVIQALLSIDSPYVAKLYETSTYNGFPIEIIPYYKNGSLQGKTCSYDDLIRMVIPNINEGLKALHDSGIIHKDLKPSNIMLADDDKSVAIIDFGISSVVSEGSTVVVTKTGMTPEYSAPETFRNLFLEESDYYSFGITLFELFCGYTPYANMSSEEIEQYVSVQRIPFPENMPALLQDFISALTYYDITNRKNKSNPNRRWTYDEVNKWLNGESLVIPGEGIGNVGKGIMPTYIFMNESFTDPASLVTAFAKNWEEGKKQLFRGMATAHFRAFNQDIAKHCIEAEEEASRTNGKDDIIFWKLLYQINPKLKGLYWRGQVFESLPALGRDMLERLWKKDKSQYPYYTSILTEKLLSQYVAMAAPKNESLKKAATAIEDSYQFEINNHMDMQRTFYLMAYTISGQKLLCIAGQHFRTVGELAGYMRSQLDESFEAFESLCHKLVDYDGNLDIQLEAWLTAIGKKKELDRWRSLMNE
ncbi:Serine/threonine-protein kinase pkn5 [Pelotomaculum schinkii]|uniref:Serine/threonine-protein kinase pkn5 n=1 Tax=Pelotomaculum schinkii TaxID=78350 RepID=A0A4Y7RHI9_9FIRM|nr:protein kinase [Pelotomaculum schinkii]TEB07767.1 Serine/threonine-protein kinase pkn5 [Pelotomaculum schinkii]